MKDISISFVYSSIKNILNFIGEKTPVFELLGPKGTGVAVGVADPLY